MRIHLILFAVLASFAVQAAESRHGHIRDPEPQRQAEPSKYLHVPPAAALAPLPPSGPVYPEDLSRQQRYEACRQAKVWRDAQRKRLPLGSGTAALRALDKPVQEACKGLFGV